MASAESQKPLCPVCHRADQVKKLQTAYEGGLQRFAPPPMPVKQISMMRTIGIGVVIVSICVFFVIVLIGSESTSIDPIVQTILVALTLLSIVAALALSALAFQRVIRGDRESQLLLPAWDQAMANWSRLSYCVRDNVVFDPQTSKTVSDQALATLLSLDAQHTEQASVALAHK